MSARGPEVYYLEVAKAVEALGIDWALAGALAALRYRNAVDHVLTVEDVIVHKVIAWRTRDRSDIRSILEAGHDIDWTYVRGWAEEFGYAARVDELVLG